MSTAPILMPEGNTARNGRVLVVDDESTITHVVQMVLEENGCDVQTAGSAEEGLEILEHFSPDVALLDIILPGMSGLDMLDRIKETAPSTEVLIMTSQSSLETALRAIRQGAYDYIEKPFEDIRDVWFRTRRALDKHSLSVRNQQLLHEQIRQNHELSATVMRLTSLIDAGRAMGEFHSLAELLDCFIGLVSHELDVERASLMLLEGDTDLRIAASRGITTVDVDEVRVPLGEGIAGTVAKSGEPFLVTDTATDERVEEVLNPTLSDSFISAPIVLSIPIKSQDKVLGVINVTNRRSGKKFGDNDLAYLAGLAGQAAVAIERTAHFEKLQEAYESLQNAQDQVVRNERLKALGEMAAGVAHDFNNALSVILGRADLLLRTSKQGGSNGDMVPHLETLRKIAARAVETIRRIQDYTRVRKDTPDATVDLNLVVQEAVEMTRPKWHGERGARTGTIDVQMELGEIPTISGNAVELNQMISNLIFNAVEAMPEGGRLTFRTHQEEDRLVLAVEDTGVGISEEAASHLFEPFFTTKGKGQGLGLSIVFGIVSRHGGEITAGCRQEGGTAFRLTFPPAQPAAEAPAPTAARQPAPSRAVKVLLVDDDDAVREFYTDALSFGGHQVIAVPGGSEALARLGQDAFDLVITDLSMVEMSGLDVARGVKSLKPSLPVVLISGLAVQQDNEEVQEAGVDFVLPKPCEIDTLLDTVQLAVGIEVRGN